MIEKAAVVEFQIKSEPARHWFYRRVTTSCCCSKNRFSRVSYLITEECQTYLLDVIVFKFTTKAVDWYVKLVENQQHRHVTDVSDVSQVSLMSTVNLYSMLGFALYQVLVWLIWTMVISSNEEVILDINK